MGLKKLAKNFTSISSFIWRHPLASKNKLKAFYNFFSWQLFQSFNSHPVKHQFVSDSILVVEKGMVGATGNIYTGLAEFEDMAFILHVLRQDDLFVDAGANVGAYTILASKNCGAASYSYEPVPETFSFLKRNVITNEINEKVHLRQAGLSDLRGKLYFTSHLDSMNHVATNQKDLHNTIEVPVLCLDEELGEKIPQVIKIDVEGFEWKVLNGALRILSSHQLKAIIIELNGSAAKFGFSEESIHSLLCENGFRPYKYEPFFKRFTLLETYGQFNTIYIKDLVWVEERVRTSKSFNVLGKRI